MNNNIDISVNEAWEKIFAKYDVIEKVKTDGLFHIGAPDIKEFKEPRLMSKWDSSEQLPTIFKEHKINILPDSRHSYVLGDFLLYQDIPELNEHVTEMTSVELPEFESLDVNNIASEANAINVLVISSILDDFLETDRNVSTFNGRMGTGVFDFKVKTVRGTKQHISVSKAQCEIDGGFENSESVVIIEAKNVLYQDFHIRQLYYPFRLMEAKVKKPIRLVFSVYSNKIFRLFEYRFTDINDYSSIELVHHKNYSLQNIEITLEELINVRSETAVKNDDNQSKASNPPFIQADSFERVISLLENMHDNPMNDEEIADLMHFGSNVSNGILQYRQSQYYYNAGKYLGLFEKNSDNTNGVRSVLTPLGKRIYKMDYKQRQLKLVSLMLEHDIFAEMFDAVIENEGILPDNRIIQNRMKELNVCNDAQVVRRSTSVKGWLKWIFNLTKLS